MPDRGAELLPPNFSEQLDPGGGLLLLALLARIMGTSVGMIEAHDGTLVDTAHDSLLERLDRLA